MKKTNKLILSIMVVLSAIVFTGCQKTPKASFACTTVCNTGDAVSMANTTSDADSYEWDFGDGSTSTETSPTHTYTSAGTRTIKLTAYSKNGKKSNSASLDITVNPFGHVTFWQSGTPSYYNVDVVINSSIKIITTNYPGGSPGCGSTGCGNFDLSAGTYNYTATEETPGTGTWSGTVTVTDGGCLDFQLL